MQKKLYLTSMLFSFLAMTVVKPNLAYADTDVNLLNYIQNERDWAREHPVNPELVKLKEAVKNEKFLRPLDPNLPAPIIFSGQDISYNTQTGEVIAQGSVRVTHNYSRLSAPQLSGNYNSGDVSLPQKAHLAEASPNSMIVDGEKGKYNFKTKNGEMSNAKGFINIEHFQGSKVYIYPHETVIYNGYVTRCPAKKPDYRLQADKIEIWPNDHMIAYNAKFMIKNAVIYEKARYIAPIGKNALKKNTLSIPIKAGYDSEDGTYIKYRYDRQLNDHTVAYANLNYYTKHNWRNVYGIDWGRGKSSVKLQDGYFEDSNNNWIKKEPAFTFNYGTGIGNSPFSINYSLQYSKWDDDIISSWHFENALNLYRKPLHFGNKNLSFYPHIGYSWTHESYNKSMKRNFYYDLTLVDSISTDFAFYTAYHYSRSTTQNSLFDYNLNDYSKKVTAGFSYQIAPKDRIVIANEFDAGNHMKTMDRDYYWYHDFHCLDMVLRYREKRNSWHVKFNIVNW